MRMDERMNEVSNESMNYWITMEDYVLMWMNENS